MSILSWVKETPGNLEKPVSYGFKADDSKNERILNNVSTNRDGLAGLRMLPLDNIVQCNYMQTLNNWRNTESVLHHRVKQMNPNCIVYAALIRGNYR